MITPGLYVPRDNGQRVALLVLRTLYPMDEGFWVLGIRSVWAADFSDSGPTEWFFAPKLWRRLEL